MYGINKSQFAYTTHVLVTVSKKLIYVLLADAVIVRTVAGELFPFGVQQKVFSFFSNEKVGTQGEEAPPLEDAEPASRNLLVKLRVGGNEASP